jgi:hypothetical protein
LIAQLHSEYIVLYGHRTLKIVLKTQG